MNETESSGKYKYIIEDCIMPLNFYTYGQAFTGSGNGKRYRINMGKRELPLPEGAAEGSKPHVEKYLTLETWPEPYAYDVTDKSGIVLKEYAFDEESYRKLLSDLDSELGAE